MHGTLVHDNASLYKEDLEVQKILFGQTFTDILSLCCHLDLEVEHSNPIFSKGKKYKNLCLAPQWEYQKGYIYMHKNLSLVLQ